MRCDIMREKYIPVAFSITPEQNRWIENEAVDRVQGTVLAVNKSVVIREAIELLKEYENGKGKISTDKT